VGLGSNLADPEQQIRTALAELQRLPETVFALRSSLYRSAAVGPAGQPDYLNAVAALVTLLAPERLLEGLQEIENAHGRDRSGERWGPRSLDLDLLAYGSVRMTGAELTLPHPRIAGRNFVLFPWSEIAPSYRVPGLGTVAELAERVSATDPAIEKTGPTGQ